MVYVVVKQSPMYRQMSLDELWFTEEVQPTLISQNTTNTKTYEVENISYQLARHTGRQQSTLRLIRKLKDFNNEHADLFNADKKSLYREFYIPKRSGGLRKIDAPNEALMTALRDLKKIFEEDFGALYHTSAFAYIKKRSTIDLVKRHQRNESRWFAKFDLSNFFGSTTPEYLMKMLSMVYPFSEVVRIAEGREELGKALNLAFLDGGLPQGTPISPTLTNIMMIPVDYKLFNTLRDFNKQRYIYTRYADDFIISSRYDFNPAEVERLISKTLADFGAPFMIKREKTRYGSSAGSNWNLGVMLNKDNEITVGHKKKKQFQTMLASYIMDKSNGVNWEYHDIQVMEGYRSYYKMVEGDTIDRIVEHINQKFNVDVVEMIKQDLRG